MKKRFFYSIPAISFLLLLTKILPAQEYGTINYTITDNWSKKIASCEYISQEEKDRSVYVWGQDDEYIHNSVLKFTPEAYIYENVKDENNEYGYAWRTSEYIIYRDLRENKTYDVIRTLNKLYVIEDSIRFQNWKIKNDIKEIAGHICMNAYYRDTIKDKDIVAWFALDMPIPYGPQEYGGLPGMILEINMNNGAVVISATHIVTSDEKFVIEKPSHKRKAKNVNINEFNDVIDKFVKESKKNKRPYFYTIEY